MTDSRLSKPVLTLWLLYTIFIVYGTTIPFHFATDSVPFLDKLRALPLNPLISADTGRRLSIPDAVQNILFFLPFGALGFLARYHHRASKALARIALITIFGLLLSAAVEALQLLMADRVASTADVMTNTMGGFLGATAAWMFRGMSSAGLRRLRNEGMADMESLRPLAIAGIVLAIAAWQPFDATLEVGSVATKIRSLQSDVFQFNGLRDEGMALMIALFFATTLASYLSVLGELRAGLKAFVLGSVIVCALELSQLVIASRMPGLWDAMVAVTGVGLGALLWTMASRVMWPRLWLAVFVSLTAGASALQNLSPFIIADHFHSVGWFPMLGYYEHTTFETLSHVIELMLLYFPLGFWLSRSARRPFITALMLTLAIAGPIEYLQGWIVGRYPDITDVGVSLIGATFGVWLGLPTSSRALDSLVSHEGTKP